MSAARTATAQVTLDESYEACRLLNKRHGTTYYWSTKLLPAVKQPHVHALQAGRHRLGFRCDQLPQIVGSAAAQSQRAAQFVGHHCQKAALIKSCPVSQICKKALGAQFVFQILAGPVDLTQALTQRKSQQQHVHQQCARVKVERIPKRVLLGDTGKSPQQQRLCRKIQQYV